MPFGTQLQRPGSHEALLRLHDAEIRLLENIRKCVQHRIKSDKEYAMSLMGMITQAQKLENSEFSSPLFQGWNTIITETEKIIQAIKSNAEELSGKTIEKLNLLINEKRASRKSYAEEKQRLDNELYSLKKDVELNKSEYSKLIDKLKLEKAKYEDLYTKGKAGSKFDEAKNKYHKTSIRLHKTHNDYVLSLREYTHHQKDYLHTILPTFLSYHQTVQEDMAQQCKDILYEYASLTTVSQESYTKPHQQIKQTLQSLQPKLEYDEFLEKNGDEQLEEIKLTFIQDLLDDYKGTLRADDIAVDDLTLDTLNQRRTMYEEKLKICQSEREKKETERSNIKGEVDGLTVNNDTDAVEANSLRVKKRAIQILDKEVKELECKEGKHKKLYDLLNGPITELGDDNPPVGLEVLDIDGSVSPTSNQSDTSSLSGGVSSSGVGGALGSAAANIKGKLTRLTNKNPFKKHSNALPKPPSKDYLDDSNKQSAAGGSYEDTNPMNDTEEQVIEIPADGSYIKMSINPNRPLIEEEWFHGVLPREEVQRLLINDGDYIVRESKNRKTNETQYVLSVQWQGHKHFIIQKGDQGGWRFEGPQYNTIQELVFHQHKSGVPVTSRSQAILKKPVIREDWQLKNDDIELGRKIGNGNFGDVFKGTYKGEQVAVKTCREILPEDQKKKFLQEGRILRQYDHPNIVRFIGIAAQKQPVMIVMEYVEGGALLNFLRKNGLSQSVKQLIKMCEDAAAGMAYLESQHCIHRDLAARNCLVGSEHTVKISDFGMSREEEEYTVSDGLKQIPIKWTAPEALNYGKYTSLCDVWSYGILMWEIFSNGATPYPGLTNQQSRDRIEAGYRMPPPDRTPDPVYELMKKCWESEAEKRPHFEEIFRELQKIRRTI